MPWFQFADLEDSEADALLEQYIARAGPRLAQFKREVAARGGPPVGELDGSLESLPKIWNWFVEHAGDGDDELPPWYEPDPPEFADERLAPAVLHDADGLAHYIAEVFRHAKPDLQWGLHRFDRRLRAESQNRPMLTSDSDFADVLPIAYGKALKWRNSDNHDPEELVRLFAAYGIT